MSSGSRKIDTFDCLWQNNNKETIIIKKDIISDGFWTGDGDDDEEDLLPASTALAMAMTITTVTILVILSVF